MVGRVDKLEPRKAINHWKATGLDLSPLLWRPEVGDDVGRYCPMAQDHGLDAALDRTALLALAAPALERGEAVKATLPIRNVNRVVGTMVGSEVDAPLRRGRSARRHDPLPLPGVGRPELWRVRAHRA